MTCPSCGTELPQAARFCMSCGAPAADGGMAAKGSAGERRHVTVVFADLVGSTELAGRVDPEVFSDVVQAFHRTAASVMERHGGHVVKLLGDGLLVAFGYPLAHEDDAEQAVRAAWDLPRAVRELNESLELDMELAVRSGVHTGVIVVDASEGDEPQLLGETLNVASRLESEAEPGTVVVSDATLQLMPGIFVTRDLGIRSLRGITQPVQLHQIVQPSGVRSRLDVATRLTPLVGRDHEIGLILDRWAAVEEGEGQVVLIGAEPGMGKSRLVRVLRERLVDTPHSWLECRCSPHGQNTAFGPIIELMSQGLDFAEGDLPEERLASLERGMALVGMEEHTAVLGTLLGLPVGDAGPPEQLNQRVVAACARWTMALSREQPLVVAVEDLHWSDPSSLEVLAALVDGVPDLAVLVAATHRPEFDPPWPNRDHMARLTLGRLRARQAAEMVAALPGGDQLSDEVATRVVERAGGIPLFVEELTKAVAEAGAATEAEVPPTLQDSLMARLDRLPRGKEVAQVGSVIGREFDQRLLEDVARLDDAALTQGLVELVDAELLYRRGEPPDASYIFKHALVQDTAYGSLLRRTRRELHARIAIALELREAGDEVLAHHLEESDQSALAAERWARAAQWALGHGAGREAGRHARNGLRALDDLPTGEARDPLELDLLDHAIRSAFGTTGLGIGTEAGAEDERRYLELAERIGTPRQRAGARMFLSVRLANQGDLDGAQQVGEEILALAEGDAVITHLSHAVVCMAVVFRGDFSAGREYGQLALEADVDPDAVRAEIGTDFGVWLPWWLSISEAYQGRLDTAMALAEPAPERARDAPLTFDRVSAWLVPCQVRAVRGEYEMARDLARRALDVLGDDDAPLAAGFSHVYHGWCRALSGDLEGAAEAQEGLALLGEYGSTSGLGAPYFVFQAAEATLVAGQVDEAIELTDLGLAIVEDTDQRGAGLGLMRVRAEALLQGDPPAPDEAEAQFRQGIEAAEQLGGVYEAFRMCASFAPLLQKDGRAAEARGLLGPALADITEGRDAPIVREAEELLRSL